MARRKSRIRGLRWDPRINKWLAEWLPAKEEYTPSGRRKRKHRVLGADYEVAEKVFREILRNVELEKAGLCVFNKQNLALSVIRDKYLVDLETRVSVRHFKNVRGNLNMMIDRLQGQTVASLSIEKVLEIRRDLLAERSQSNPGKAKNRTETVNKKVKALIACLNWAKKSGVISENPIGGGRIQRLNTVGDIGRERHVLTRQEWLEFRNEMEADDQKQADWHDRIPQTPMFDVLMGTGFRLGEACRLTWGAFGQFEGRWRLTLSAKITKTDKARTNPISDDLAIQLNALRALQGKIIGKLPGAQEFILLSPNGHPWAYRNCESNIRERLNRVIARVEARPGTSLKKSYPDGTTIDLHSFRHTYCTWLRAAGVSYDDARDLMGHSSDSLTRQIYTKEDSLDHVKGKAVDKLAAFSKGNDSTRRVEEA